MSAVVRVRLAALALSAALLVPVLASAQINPFRGRGADKLSGEDVRMITEAGSKLLAQQSLAKGDAEHWADPATGASGDVRVTGSSHHRGMVCHTLAYHVRMGSRTPSRTSTLIWCRTQDGSWKIAS